jgi:hypothetical protein
MTRLFAAYALGGGYLSELPIHELKIDKGFVIDMLDNPANAAIVRSIIDLGHNLALRVVGEGVETDRHSPAFETPAATWHRASCLPGRLSSTRSNDGFAARSRRTSRHDPPHACGDGETRNRTEDTTIFSRVLYQLSYLAVAGRCYRLIGPLSGRQRRRHRWNSIAPRATIDAADAG